MTCKTPNFQLSNALQGHNLISIKPDGCRTKPDLCILVTYMHIVSDGDSARGKRLELRELVRTNGRDRKEGVSLLTELKLCTRHIYSWLMGSRMRERVISNTVKCSILGYLHSSSIIFQCDGQ